MINKYYNKKFYEIYDQLTKESAEAIVPVLVDLCKPKSVLDVGCGIGTWLSVFQKHGIEVFGIDGNWVRTKSLHIPPDKFEARDLSSGFSLDRKFDMAICLEVAEHLPQAASKRLIRSLVKSAPIVYFSAAIPFQGGTNHINEQWKSYWASIFETFGFTMIDLIRPLIWNHKSVKWWYKQNGILYVRKDYLSRLNIKKSYLFDHINDNPVDIIHPKLYLKFSDYRTMSTSRTLKRILNKVVFKISENL